MQDNALVAVPEGEDPAAAEDPLEASRRHLAALAAAEGRLAAAVAYLRATHRYCLFCGCGYGDEAEMAEACPGPSEADH